MDSPSYSKTVSRKTTSSEGAAICQPNVKGGTLKNEHGFIDENYLDKNFTIQITNYLVLTFQLAINFIIKTERGETIGVLEACKSQSLLQQGTRAEELVAFFRY